MTGLQTLKSTDEVNHMQLQEEAKNSHQYTWETAESVTNSLWLK